MTLFAERFPDPDILPMLSAKLSWSHILELLPLNSTFQASKLQIGKSNRTGIVKPVFFLHNLIELSFIAVAPI
jgi:hypothetical protein